MGELQDNLGQLLPNMGIRLDVHTTKRVFL
jgi:hypothetical protein